MAHFKLEIGPTVSVIEKPTRCYNLTVKYEHGDADSWTENEYVFLEDQEPRMQELQFVLFTLEFLKHHYTQHMSRLELRNLLVSALDITDTAASQFIDQFWEMDGYYMDMMAGPGGWKLSYTDQYGVDHYVKVTSIE